MKGGCLACFKILTINTYNPVTASLGTWLAGGVQGMPSRKINQEINYSQYKNK